MIISNYPKILLRGVDIASIIASDDSPRAEILISDGNCITKISSEMGNSQHRSKIDYSGEDVKFSINPEFLREMIGHSSELVVTEGRIKLETDNYKFVVALYSEE